MDRSTRAELLQTVETQKEQLQKYQQKLRDLVAAYKGLQKEKEALEASVQALSVASKAENEASSDDSRGEPRVGETGNEEFADPLNAMGNSPDPTQSDVMKLKEQLATLTNALATVSQEKSKMEANFLAEKKKIKQDHEDIVSQLETANENYETEVKTLQEQLQELKSKIRSQQHEREKEQTDHVLMLRELQTLLAKERSANEDVELQLEETQDALRQKENEAELREEYEKKVYALSQELGAVRQRLKDSEQKSHEPSPLLLDLQQELAEMKAQNRIAVQLEHKKANEAEERLQAVARQAEDRVSSLETKLSELSGVVGNYERLRFQDQTAIQKLKERVTQLDMENTALARAAHTNTENEDDYSNLDIQALVEKMTKLKGFLKLANERSERPVNIEEVLRDNSDEDNDENAHKRCQEEYLQLKEEFERYKLRAQSVLKNKNTKDPAATREIETFKAQVSELKDKLRNMITTGEDEEAKHKKTVEDLRKTITKLQDSHRSELSAAETDYKQKIAQLELQIRKHRDRTVALLAEKDCELDELKGHESGFRLEGNYRRHPSLSPELGADGRKSTGSEESVAELLAKPVGLSSVQGESQLLHFVQEQARRDVEIQQLRKTKYELETALRELQLNCLTKAENSVDEIDSLKEEIRKLERNKSRESANLEYLKNVVYRYMISSNTQGKKQILNAIATILQFSPAEKAAVRHHISSWWGYVYGDQGKPKK